MQQRRVLVTRVARGRGRGRRAAVRGVHRTAGYVAHGAAYAAARCGGAEVAEAARLAREARQRGARWRVQQPQPIHAAASTDTAVMRAEGPQNGCCADPPSLASCQVCTRAPRPLARVDCSSACTGRTGWRVGASRRAMDGGVVDLGAPASAAHAGGKAARLSERAGALGCAATPARSPRKRRFRGAQRRCRAPRRVVDAAADLASRQMPSAHTASEQKRVPATPAPAASIAQVLAPESADGLGFAAGAAEHTPLAAGGSAGEAAWQRRHAALAAYLHRAEAAQMELQHELEALPVRRHAVETRLRCSLCGMC